MRFYIIIENTEEEIMFEGYVENVPSIEELKNEIEKKFYPCVSRYYICTRKPETYRDDSIVEYVQI